MTNKYEVYLRDANKNRIGQIDRFATLSFIRRFNGVGTWALSGSFDGLAGLANLCGIIVMRNGEPYFSGDLAEFDDQDGQTLSDAGYSDEDVLAAELALPVPGGAPYTVDYDVRTGVGETIIKQFVDLNIGPDGQAARQAPGLTIEADYGRGTSITGRARFDNLLTLVNSLAEQSGLGFRVLNRQFQIYQPTDRSNQVIFSKELGTLGTYKLHWKRGGGNYIFVGGAGTGSARTVYEAANAQGVLDWGRRELFVDKSNTSVATELAAAADETLSRNTDEISLTFAPIVCENMVPVDDYDIGDWVQAVIQGEVIKQQVREIKTTIDVSSGAEVIELAIGTDGATTDPTGLARVYQRMKSLDKRIYAMERK